MKHVFIVNKISGKGTNMKLMGPLKDIVTAMGIDHEIRLTQYPKHAKRIASEYSGKEDIVIYALGGDGTLYEVLNGMDIRQPLAVIPSGSGNDFYRLFQSEKKIDLEKIICDTIKAPIQKIDFGTFNDQRFINTLSVGIDARVNEDASRMIRKTFVTRGPAYIGAIVKNIVFPKATGLKITVDDDAYNGNYYICSIMNGQYYGNGKHACPQALVNDGYLDLTIVEKCSPFALYHGLIQYLNGDHLNNELFTTRKVKQLKIESEELFDYQADGENFKSDTLTVKVIEKGLNLKIAKAIDDQ